MSQPRSRRRCAPASTENRTNEKQKQRRRKGRPAQDWALMKPIIYRYHEERKTQNEIVDLLAKEHGFVIQLNMLKKRCKEWGLRKYFKSVEHDAVETELARCAEQGSRLPADFKVNGRFPHLDRVYRRSRNKSRLSSSFLRKSSEWHAQVSRICLRASSADHCTEMTLMQTKAYWTSALTTPVHRTPAFTKPMAISLTEASAQRKGSTLDPYTLTIGFLIGLRLINNGQKQQGWQEIHHTCAKTTEVMKKQQPDLLTGLLSFVCATSWSGHPELFRLIVKYLLSSSLYCLGTEHPISKTLEALVTLVAAKTPVASETYKIIPELASKVIVDLNEAKQSQWTIDSSYIHSVEVDLVTRVRARLGPLAVRNMIEKKYSHWRSTLGPRNRHTLSMRFDLAKTFLFEAGCLDKQEERDQRLIAEQKGENILRKIVAQGEKFPADRYRIGSYFLAAEALARLYFANQKYTSAHTFFLRAVLWATEKLGSYHPYTGGLLTYFRALRKLVELGLVEVPADEEHLWQVHMCKEGSANAVEEGDWAPYHDEIDLEDNLELAELNTDPQMEGVHKPLGNSLGDNSIGALSRADMDSLPENTYGSASQGFEHHHVQRAQYVHADDLDTFTTHIGQDAPFAAEMTFEGLLNASAQDMLELFPEDHMRQEMQLDDLDQPLRYSR